MKQKSLVKFEANETVEQTVREILSLADEMAASTASLNHHTYCVFLNAREMLRKKVEELCSKIR